MVFLSLWIDKGFGLIVGGFVPNMFEKITGYWPTLPETLITIAVWAAGFLVLTILYKIAVSVRAVSVRAVSVRAVSVRAVSVRAVSVRKGTAGVEIEH